MCSRYMGRFPHDKERKRKLVYFSTMIDLKILRETPKLYVDDIFKRYAIFEIV